MDEATEATDRRRDELLHLIRHDPAVQRAIVDLCEGAGFVWNPAARRAPR